MSDTVDVPCYIQVEPEWSPWGKGDSPEDVRGAKAVRITQTPARQPKGGALSIKVTLRIPKAAFTPLRPEAVVIIPADFTNPNPVEVIAGDANTTQE